MHLKSFGRLIAPLFAGLATAQLLGFWQVWQSNQYLLSQTRAVTAAGWLAIPCGPASAALASFKAAFWGGLFFTLSLGRPPGAELAFLLVALTVAGALGGMR